MRSVGERSMAEKREAMCKGLVSVGATIGAGPLLGNCAEKGHGSNLSKVKERQGKDTLCGTLVYVSLRRLQAARG
jgi:hypothetical protein